jgi:hypothetical protein
MNTKTIIRRLSEIKAEYENLTNQEILKILELEILSKPRLPHGRR